MSRPVVLAAGTAAAFLFAPLSPRATAHAVAPVPVVSASGLAPSSTGVTAAAASTPVAVRFEGLSPLAAAAEAQKDVLLGLLREAHSRDALYVEIDGVPEERGRAFTVRCLSCATPDAGESLLPATLAVTKRSGAGDRVSKATGKGPFGVPFARARFDVGSEGGSVTTWIVEIDELAARYVVRLARDARAGAILAVGDFGVETCWFPSACPGDLAFPSEPEAFRAHDEFAGQETLRSLPKGALLAARDLRPPLLVKAGDAVRVVVRTGAEGLSIRARGRALRAGARGETVDVEIASPSAQGMRGRIVKAKVSGAGEVDHALE